ncbi:hypothetical protein [Arthrobacter nitrophenolicus]|uniref:Uncharacterized protein n=1 Tax=Arthrobacter nitrophenolicus TaxID=683150 RepID=A0A4R5XSY3_9MICC|nr:hypothetical protein [Arthrobacter nitrophenolicus]TDL34035.1 hypothetical protein E2R57_16125 [Arthrobacter nitrophenolicus]
MTKPSWSETWLGDFVLRVCCRPQPVRDSGSSHDVWLHATGPDDFVRVKMVVGVYGPLNSHGLEIVDQFGTGNRIVTIPVGQIPSGAELTESLGVRAQSSGQGQWEKIITTVEFCSWWAVDDPLDDTAAKPYVVSDTTNIEVRP